jgi:hypothetical protein
MMEKLVDALRIIQIMFYLVLNFIQRILQFIIKSYKYFFISMLLLTEDCCDTEYVTYVDERLRCWSPKSIL